MSVQDTCSISCVHVCLYVYIYIICKIIYIYIIFILKIFVCSWISEEGLFDVVSLNEFASLKIQGKSGRNPS